MKNSPLVISAYESERVFLSSVTESMKEDERESRYSSSTTVAGVYICTTFRSAS